MNTRWLITGAGGQLGSVLLRELVHRGQLAVGTVSDTGPQPAHGKSVRVNLLDFEALRQLLNEADPQVIIHCAAITSIDESWKKPDHARRTNLELTAELSRWAGQHGSRLVFLSTDLVFDGSAAPYSESATPRPLSVYGRSKADAEKVVIGERNGLVIRPSLMYGIPAVARPTTFCNQLDALKTGRPLKLFEDEFRTPLWLEDAAAACIEAAGSDVTGILQIAGPERLSRLEMGRLMAASIGANDGTIIPARQRDMQTPEPRPADVSLDCSRFAGLFGHPPGRPMADAMTQLIH